MSAEKVALLGAIAGSTIFLGLPVGRLNASMPRVRAMLNATAIGILIFLLWDILAAGWEPIEEAVAEHHYAFAIGNGLIFAGFFSAGLVGLVYFDRWVARRVAAHAVGGPGAASVEEMRGLGIRLSNASMLALMIAVGIGLHNFAEGLAIGNSAATGELSLAILLVIGFAAHNATEGFGIVAPMTAEGSRPSWRYLALLGLIAGGPTFFGTLVGQRVTNVTLSIGFLTLAAGSILYVVIELLAVARRSSYKILISWGIVLGLMLGFLTDGILVAAGA